MKAWAYSAILASFLSGIATRLLPEKSHPGIAKMMRWLCALVLILIVFSPVLEIVRSGGAFFQSLSLYAGEVQNSSAQEEKILTEMAKSALEEIEAKAKMSFPGTDFYLEAELDEGYALKKIAVVSSDEAFRERLCRFIEKNYGIETEEKTA